VTEVRQGSAVSVNDDDGAVISAANAVEDRTAAAGSLISAGHGRHC
jgi:hypothetical protein